MDGPISNLKFFSEIKKLRIEDEPTSLIDTGCYNLHVHFCGTRWVEDKMVTEKLIKLWPNMIKVFDFWNILCKPKQPCSKSYENTKKGIEDPLTMAKLHFLSFVARLLQPFLKVFRGDGLMIPFLCNNIRSIYISLLELIVKAKVLENVESYDLLQVVNNDDNLLQTKRIHVGFAAKSEIKRLLSANKTGWFLIFLCVFIKALFPPVLRLNSSSSSCINVLPEAGWRWLLQLSGPSQESKRMGTIFQKNGHRNVEKWQNI